MTQSAQQWWGQTRADEQALMSWLRRQYHGEAMAARRLEAFVARYGEQAKRPQWLTTVATIITQEREHARWIGELLASRGEQARLLDEHTERYWEQTLEGIESWETGCAVAAHAERMRLERIRVIAADEEAPADIRAVFARILPEEEFHERAFGALTSPEALELTRDQHERGARALGLEP